MEAIQGLASAALDQAALLESKLCSTTGWVAEQLGLEAHQGDALAWAVTFVVTILTFGHVLAAFPIALIGQNTGGGVRTRLWGYDNSRGEFPHFAAFLLVLCLGLIGFYLLRPWPIVFFALAARIVWYNLFAPMTSKPPPPREGEQVLNETPQFPKTRHTFDELHK